jgi:hypothetical protein
MEDKNANYKRTWLAKNREHNNRYMREYRHRNAAKIRAANREWRKNNPHYRIWSTVKERAKKHGMEFNLEMCDVVIPAVCPILGIPLVIAVGRMSDSSPSIDRIDNSEGYVKGNIQIISMKANRIKNDATPEELMKIALWVNGAK